MSSSSRQRRRHTGPRSRWRSPPGALAAGLLVLAVVAVAAVLARGDGDPAAGDLAGTPVERFMHVHGLEIAPWAPGDVFVSTHQGLIRIDPEGDWWFVSEQPHDFMGFAVHPAREGVMFTSGHPAVGSGLENPLGLLISHDSGRTWEVRSLHGRVDFHAMAVHTDGEVIYGYDVTGGRLLRSRDGGHDWDARQSPGRGGVLSLAVRPEDPETVWAGTPEGLVVSGDGATTWTEALGRAPVTAVGVDPDQPERVIAYVAAPDQGLMESTDGGRTWQSLGLDLGEDPVAHLAVHPDDGNLLYAGSHGEALYRTTDGGRSWQPLADGGVPTQARP